MSAHRPRLVVPLTSLSHLFPLHLHIRWPCTARKASSHPIPDSTIYVSTYRIRSDPASLRSFFGICIAVFVREMRRCRCHISLSPRNMKLAVNMYIVTTYGRDTENTIDRGASVPHVPILSSHSQSRPLPFSPNSAKKWTVSHTLDFLRLALLASRRSLRFEDSYREHYAATTFSPLHTCVALWSFPPHRFPRLLIVNLN